MNASVKLLEQRCPACNAPLQVGPNDPVVTCRYCGNSIQIQRQKAPRNVPPVSAFGTPGHVPSTVLYIPTAASVGASLIPVLIPVVILLVVAIVGAVSALGRRFVSLPATCRPNETLTISGKTFDGKEPAIVAGVNCKITIKDSTLKSADAIVKGGINLELRIVNSKLTSKTNAIELASTNAKIWIDAKSEVFGEDAGIKGDNNVELEVKDSTVGGGRAGIDVGTNAKLTFTDAKVNGKEAGILANGSSPKLTAKNLTVTSDEIGIHFEQSNSSIDARALTVKAGDTAIFFEQGGELKLVEKSVLTATKSDGLIMKGSSMKLQLDETQITGHDAGMRIGGNADVRMRKGTKISGGTAGIVTDYNVKLQVDGASVESNGPAVQAGSNAEVRVTTGSSVKGTPAFQFPSNPSRFDVSEGTQTGDKVIGNAASGGGSAGSDNQAIKKVIEASYAVVKTCGKGGELRVRIEVASSGKVTSVSTLSSSTSKAVETCALGRIRSLSFPSRSSSTTITTNYLF